VYRSRVRALGPLLSLLPATVMGLLAIALLHGSTSTARGVGGFALAVLAAPGLLAAGVPLSTGGGAYALAIAGSAVLWLAIGVLAARRATRPPVASWRDFWREWAWPAAGVWLGVLVALGIARLSVGSALL
jgi:hypothetical protein